MTTPSPSPDQLAAWHAYLETGSMRKAARKLGVHRDTVQKRIAALKDVHGVRTTAQLAVALGSHRQEESAQLR